MSLRAELWLRGLDLNQGPSGYEAGELPADVLYYYGKRMFGRILFVDLFVLSLAAAHVVSVCFGAYQGRGVLGPETRKNTIMGLEFRWHADGRLRDTWFGSYQINGKRYGVNLDITIGGTPPQPLSLKGTGDAQFERSRATALAKLQGIIEESRSKRSSERLVERLYEIKTGETIKSVKLDELATEWGRLPRKHEPDERYAGQCRATLSRFAEFVRSHNGKVVELAQVTRSTARAFMEAEGERHVAGKTWNDTMKLLRATFHHLLPPGALNPFEEMPTKDSDTVFRKPFTPEELKAILDAAKDDDFIRPIIVTGMCTAMRRGDCCLLKWKDVDLARRFITVKTAKTGQTVSIPIFPLLYDELQGIAEGRAESRKQKVERDTSPRPSPRSGEGVLGMGTAGAGIRREGDTSPRPSPRGGEGVAGAGGLPHGDLVFPEQGAMYEENPDGITWRVKKVLAWALMGKAESRKQKAEMGLPEVPEEETRRRGHEFLSKLPESEKKQRMLAVFDGYMDGKRSGDVAAAAGVSKGSVSGYLNEIEGGIECRVVRGRAEGGSVTAVLKGDNSLLRVKREDGGRRASVRDFHSLRVTWVTLALTAGVPLELVQKVTGHKTADVVLKHYFQPGREDFRMALQSAMPKLLTGGGDVERRSVGAGREERGAVEREGEKGKWGERKAEMGVEGGGQKSEDRGQDAEGDMAREELREMIAIVRPVALRERMMRAWMRL